MNPGLCPRDFERPSPGPSPPPDPAKVAAFGSRRIQRGGCSGAGPCRRRRLFAFALSAPPVSAAISHHLWPGSRCPAPARVSFLCSGSGYYAFARAPQPGAGPAPAAFGGPETERQAASQRGRDRPEYEQGQGHVGRVRGPSGSAPAAPLALQVSAARMEVRRARRSSAGPAPRPPRTWLTGLAGELLEPAGR